MVAATPLLPLSDAQSTPTLSSTPSEAPRRAPIHSPHHAQPVNSSSIAGLSPNDAPPLITLINQDMGMTSSPGEAAEEEERKHKAWHPQGLPIALAGVLGLWAAQGNRHHASTGLPISAGGCAGGCGVVLLSALAWGRLQGHIELSGVLSWAAASLSPRASSATHSSPSPSEGQIQGPPNFCKFHLRPPHLPASPSQEQPQATGLTPIFWGGGRWQGHAHPETDHPSRARNSKIGDGALWRGASVTRGCCRSMGALT